ncbi:uncharacterized protein LOC105842644 [Bombyx mori]|uniref:Uncharacterized protein n=1 Tax=Bombyx mori TaxID=7091 RepID=A0A8R2R2M4_BOMMO|nr:uncharacterized protein LOC105842644 [Bombyx mori]XP_037873439.1 uncharacterized protein LOC105842644 [Bombyx mori]
MQAAPARYVSVSELYTTDEVELLLDEIRELEPTSCRGEDVQDFEIAGSGCVSGGLSPVGTERSWDSHAQYRAAVSPGAGPAPAQLYCAPRRLLAPRAAASLVLAGAGAAAAVCVWVAGGRTVRLPLAGRLRALLLAALTSALLHATLALLAATRLQAQLALDWPRVWLVAALWTAVSLTCGGSLTLHAIVAAPEYRYAPKYIADLLYAAAGLALSSAALAVAVAAGTCARRGGGAAYRAVPARDNPPL